MGALWEGDTISCLGFPFALCPHRQWARSRTVSQFRIWLVGATGIEPVTPPV
jgi:hypothetical protein